MKIIVDQISLKDSACKALEQMIKDTGNKPLLLLLSGGSALEILDCISEEVFSGQNITVGMLDDRYSQDPSVNNYSMLQSTGFYLRGLRRGVVFLDTTVSEFETLETYAARYESEIKKWKKLYPDGIIRAVAGMGPDGHTAGIMPFPEDPKKFEELFYSEKWIVGYDVGTKSSHQFRITSTLTFMKMFNLVLMYAAGDNKREALAKLKVKEGTVAETPVRIVKEIKNTKVYTDIKL